MATSLEDMFSKQINNPNDLIGQQYSFLKDMNYLPKMSMEWLPGAEEGMYNNWENTLKINPGAVYPERTLAHEFQHALDHSYAKLYSEIKQKPNRTKEEQQFLDNLPKFEEPTKIPTTGLNSYRARQGEMKAFGVANSRYPQGAYEGSSHLDPTMATEQAILFDMAQKAKRSSKAVVQQPQTDYVDKSLNAVSDWAQGHIDTIKNLFK